MGVRDEIASQLFGERTPLERDCLSRCLLEKVLGFSGLGETVFWNCECLEKSGFCLV